MSTTPALPPTGLDALTLADPPSSTNVGNVLGNAGNTFSSLLLNVGNAVASTQQKLTENSAATTKALAEKNVQTIAVRQIVFGETGEPDAANTKDIMASVPVLTYVPPVYYELPVVRLQGRFTMEEFATASDTSINNSSSGFGVGVGMSFRRGAFSAGASGGFSSSSQTINAETATDRTQAVGQMRMFARIQPREDVGIPKPLQVFNGPRITISTADLDETLDTDNATVLARELSVVVQLNKSTGEAIEGQLFSIDTQGVPWTIPAVDALSPQDLANPQKKAAAHRTDANGRFEIRLKRTFPKPIEGAPEVDRTAKPTVVTAILGMLTNNTTVTI